MFDWVGQCPGDAGQWGCAVACTHRKCHRTGQWPARGHDQVAMAVTGFGDAAGIVTHTVMCCRCRPKADAYIGCQSKVRYPSRSGPGSDGKCSHGWAGRKLGWPCCGPMHSSTFLPDPAWQHVGSFLGSRHELRACWSVSLDWARTPWPTHKGLKRLH